MLYYYTMIIMLNSPRLEPQASAGTGFGRFWDHSINAPAPGPISLFLQIDILLVKTTALPFESEA